MSHPAQPTAAGTPLTVEAQMAENKSANPEPEVASQADNRPVVPDPTDEQLEREAAEWSPRKDIYDRLDRHNQKVSESPDGFLVNPATEDSPALGEEPPAAQIPAAPADTPPAQGAPTEDQPQKGPVTLSRAEFLEVFQDFRIKDRIAGEDVEAPVKEWIKATGLERHLTQKIMDVSRKEREVLARWEKTQEATKLSEEQVQRKYDEMYSESPYKANQFLRELEASRQAAPPVPQDETARANIALKEFQTMYPELTQDDWVRMNNPAFWKKHHEIVRAREEKQWFPLYVLAYTKLQEEKLETERAIIRQQQEEKNKGVSQAIQRKREGAVLRTTVMPQKTPTDARKSAPYDREKANREYISSLRNAARSRMGIQE